jgi:hypothetical protein
MDWRASPYVTPKAGTSVAEGQVVRICQSPYWSQEARQGSVGTVVSKKVTHAGRGWRTYLVKVRLHAGPHNVWSFYESELEVLT